MSLLAAKGLNVKFKTTNGIIYAVNDIDFTINTGKITGIVGESGSGKSQIALAIMGLSAVNSIVSGSIKFDGKELVGMSTKNLNKIRGNEISMIFQNPMTSLNPYLTIESQLIETMVIHRNCSKSDAKKRAFDMLDAVHIPDVKNRIKLYPHEFSGGMCQRVIIAMALMCQPKLLIADEPTTALDVTVQAQILALLKDLQVDFQMATILITHDMGVVANVCNEVIVMYGGFALEIASVEELFGNSNHFYTRKLIEVTPRIDTIKKELDVISGEFPDLSTKSLGCIFLSRCFAATQECHISNPALKRVNDISDHKVACFNNLKDKSKIYD